jgi:hypothetical protein
MCARDRYSCLRGSSLSLHNLTTDQRPSRSLLRLHGEKLSWHVHTCGYKSVEIVKGYYIPLLSATPARELLEERLWLYSMYAFGVVAELDLDQGSRQHPHRGSPKQDRIQLQREARNREITWLRILLWERANSAACGRMNAFPETELTRNIEGWWTHSQTRQTSRTMPVSFSVAT